MNIRLSLRRWSVKYEKGRVLYRLYWGGWRWTPFVRAYPKHG